MGLKEEVAGNRLFVDALVDLDRQSRPPANVYVTIDGKACRGISGIRSLDSSHLILSVPLDEKGQLTEGVPDFKEVIGKTMDVRIHEAIATRAGTENKLHPTGDEVSFVAEVLKIEEGVILNRRLRHVTLLILGHRAPLDFEVPSVSLPKQPFAEVK